MELGDGVGDGVDVNVAVAVEVGDGVLVNVGGGVDVKVTVAVGSTTTATAAGVLRTVCQAHTPAAQVATKQIAATPTTVANTRFWVRLNLCGSSAVINERSGSSTGASGVESPL